MQTIVTWNVNSIHARLEHVVNFIRNHQPDYLCLQELKCMDEKFPFDAFKEFNLHCEVFGQKSYNGVAILSKKPPIRSARTFEDSVEDSHSRFILCEYEDLSLACAYVPNGQDFGTDKFKYKMEWFKRCENYFSKLIKPRAKVAMVGDFNVAPDDRDVYDPIRCREKIHCSTIEREALMDLMSVGFIDLFRMKYPESKELSWWDYREASFENNKGLRIDLILATKTLADCMTDVRIAKEERGREKPSDHAPVIAEFNF